jgi:hemerythrin-like domain-containing protein
MLDGALSDPLNPLDEQHGWISEQAVQMAAAEDLRQGQLGPERVMQLIRFYRGMVLPHFDYEERFLFPALLRVCGTPRLAEQLAQLVDEHDELRLRIEILVSDLESLEAGGRDEALERDIVLRAGIGVDRLVQHAALEDAIMMPLLRRHGAKVRAVLSRPGSLGA